MCATNALANPEEPLADRQAAAKSNVRGAPRTGEAAAAQFSLYVMGGGDHMAEIYGCIDFLRESGGSSARCDAVRAGAPGGSKPVERRVERPDRAAPGGRSGDRAEVAQVEQCRLQCPRDRRRGHAEDVEVVPELAQLALVLRAEALLLVDDEKPEVVECHTLAEQRARTDHDANALILQPVAHPARLRRRHQPRQVTDLQPCPLEPPCEGVRMLPGEAVGAPPPPPAGRQAPPRQPPAAPPRSCRSQHRPPPAGPSAYPTRSASTGPTARAWSGVRR